MGLALPPVETPDKRYPEATGDGGRNTKHDPETEMKEYRHMSDLFAEIETRLASWWRAATATRTRRLLLILLVLLPVARLVVVGVTDRERERAAATAARQELLRPGGTDASSFEGSRARFAYPPSWTLTEQRGEGHEMAMVRPPAGDGLLRVEAWSAATPESDIAYVLRRYEQDEGCVRGWELSDWSGIAGRGYGLDCPAGATVVLFELHGQPPLRIHQKWTTSSEEAIRSASYLLQQTLERR